MCLYCGSQEYINKSNSLLLTKSSSKLSSQSNTKSPVLTWINKLKVKLRWCYFNWNHSNTTLFQIFITILTNAKVLHSRAALIIIMSINFALMKSKLSSIATLVSRFLYTRILQSETVLKVIEIWGAITFLKVAVVRILRN